MKKIYYILILILCIPFTVFALNKDYKDIVKDYYNLDETENINIYLFYSKTCKHCHEEEEYLNDLKEKYQDKINIYKYEVTENIQNKKIMQELKNTFDIANNGVPFTVIGENYILGFNETYKEEFITIINKYLSDNTDNTNKNKTTENYNIPIIGKTNSVILIAIILGFIDGFNPCAMWILLLLINMCISIKDKKKMITVCLTFIITSGLIYFLSMIGLGLIIDLTTITYIRNVIAVLAIILGIYNLLTFIKERNKTGCHIVKNEKRKSIISKINNILKHNNILLLIGGAFLLATSVNIIEMACSLGFPTIFLEILTINKIKGLLKILYLLIYIFFYLIDDLIVFIISIKAFSAKGISTKYNKYVHLIGGIIMIILGLLLILKPEWIMLNF
mgnify:FL=1